MASALVSQARQLAQRLREAADPQRVRQWAQELARRSWPQAVAEQDKVREQEQVTKPEQELQQAPQRPDPVRRPAGPVPEHLREAFRHWQLAEPLIEKAKTQPLDLYEKRDVARSWDSFARLVEAGHAKVNDVQRSGIEQARREAQLQVMAAEFRILSADEMVHAYPKLEAAYFMLEAVEERSRAAGYSQAQRELVHQRSRQRIAAAIEQGQGIRLKDLIDFEQPIQAQERERPAPEQDRGRER